ncbi:prephenate dehydrogenase [Cyclobacterium lianum]|uniref:Prephenate dehydrogenase n=1 Tax=Cyclobacterium lianum TaxID=388280 RepID=A0A1M7PLH2_9BACT|nr:prephenate dehydrogenase [Cyclobacterium lianum]SHN18125.1 prephenate dehydrogenase [Cyclobacterium lianum]
MKKVHIVGLGLLGGSFAKALKKSFPEWDITGFDSNPEHLSLALEMGLISRSLEVPEKDSAVVVLATPVDTLFGLLVETLAQVGPDTMVMDFGSTKGELCRQIADHPKRNQYLAVHPIAGTENSGPAAAVTNLFDGKVLIICEMEKTDIHLKGMAYDIFEAINMKLRFMDPGDHDLHLAFVSHLSHVSSFVLGKTVLDKTEDEKNIFDMAGSGFASTVRLAKSSPAMWAPIFLENKKNVLEAMDSYIEHLRHFRKMLAEDDVDGLKHNMREANKIRDILDLKE